MKITRLTEHNVGEEHICCGFSDKKFAQGYLAKKEWLKEEFKKGHTFKKFNVRGKVFIEYVPVEESWLPIEEPGYMLITCFWVSAQYKGNGYGKKLLQESIDDSGDKKLS